MRLFITGATGYIGGSIAVRLVAAGHTVRGLVRDSAKSGLLSAHGIEPVPGSLDDEDVLAREARAADGVVNAANADHLPSLQVMLRAMEGSGKPLVHTSGSSVIGDDARGDRTFGGDLRRGHAFCRRARQAGLGMSSMERCLRRPRRVCARLSSVRP